MSGKLNLFGLMKQIFLYLPYRFVRPTLFVTTKKLLRDRFLHIGEFHLPVWADLWQSNQKSQERNESQVGLLLGGEHICSFKTTLLNPHLSTAADHKIL